MSSLLRQFVSASLLALPFVALPAHAQAPMGAERNFYFALFGGLTGGGDKLAEVVYSNGDREAIRAGGLAHLAAGVVWQPTQTPVSLQATIGWHADSINARNGDVKFTRLPFEVLGYWHGAPNLRLGGGARFVRDARLESDVGGFTDTVKFKDSTGYVLEAGLRLGPRGWVNLRYTDEEYEAESLNNVFIVPTGKTSARSFGINLVWTF